MTHAWSGPNRVPLREEQMRPFTMYDHSWRKRRVWPITPRQRQALRLWDMGLATPIIAERLGIKTVAAWRLVTLGKAKRAQGLK